jgi:electron transport complex protein RnfB
MIGITTVSVLGILAALFGLLLGYTAVRFKVEGDPIVEQIDAILPQQQCGKCGYPGCQAYAEAIVNGEAEINQCPPGGEVVILALADLLDREPISLDVEHGVEMPIMLAVIDETTCIGCTLCIQACPVDAILGAPKQMHTVIAQECTGCELCVAPCPVDCISMVAVPETVKTWKWPYPIKSKKLSSPQPSFSN